MIIDIVSGEPNYHCRYQITKTKLLEELAKKGISEFKFKAFEEGLKSKSFNPFLEDTTKLLNTITAIITSHGERQTPADLIIPL